MRVGTLAAGFVVAGVLMVGAGCSHEQHAAATAPNTMALAQGDKVGRALLAPTAVAAAAKAAHQQTEVADTSAESEPLD